MKTLARPSFPVSMGDFSSDRHAKIALATDADAENVRKTLLRNGFGEENETQSNDYELHREFGRSEEQALNQFKIEQEVAKFEEYLELIR